MTSPETGEQSAQAVVKRGGNFSAIWFLPLLALAIGLWMLFEQWRDQGPLITITFSSASGLEEGKTSIKAHDVEVGKVEGVSLSSDLKGAVVEARIDRDAERLLREDTQFWIVAPRIGLSGVSGLNTLVSGVHIELAPGQSNVKRQKFTGLIEPPVTPSNAPGMPILLSSADLVAYSVGDRVVYKGISVGQIEEVNFNVDERVVYYKTFIKAPYDQLITRNTRFWNASGLNIELTADGISVQTASLQSLLTNSVTFGVPEGKRRGAPAAANSQFTIHPDYETASSPNYRHAVEYVLLIDESVRGLVVGAPVEYRGIRIGQVRAVNFDARGLQESNQLMQGGYRIPVLIALQPAKAGYPDSSEGEERIREQINAWIRGGLRARLKTGSLLTGKLLVELQHYPDAEAMDIAYFNELPVIPTRRGEISQLTSKVEALLDNFANLPLQKTAEDVSLMARDISDTAQSARRVSENLDQLLSQAQSKRLIEQLNAALESFTRLASAYASGSDGHSEIVSMVEQLNSRLQELQPLLLQLNQQPNSLIFSSGQGRDLQPKAKPK